MILALSGQQPTYLVKLNDVWVTDFFKNIDLTGHSLDIALALDAIFLKNFDGDFLAGDGVGSYPDLAESSLSQRSPYIFV